MILYNLNESVFSPLAPLFAVIQSKRTMDLLGHGESVPYRKKITRYPLPIIKIQYTSVLLWGIVPILYDFENC